MVNILDWSQILLELDRFGFKLCKANIIDIKRGRSICAFYIDRNIFAANAVVTVDAFELNPIVAGANRFGGKSHIIRAALAADLRR
ncbi:hypothetical protein D3C77_234890 [compost metagenome]